METAWLIISAGSGPEECAYAVALTFERIQKEIESMLNITFQTIETEQSHYKKDNFRSVLIALEGEGVQSFVDTWIGTIQWIFQSPYRPHHKRKNWFVSVRQFKEPEPGVLFNIEDVCFETAKAGGPGGQHVNKTETAVRAVHIPTGKSATANGERSQLMNKKMALSRLALLFEREQSNKIDQAKSDRRHSHWELERGNPIRIYNGQTFKLISQKICKK